MDTPSAPEPANVEELLIKLKDTDEDVRIFAALQLGSLGEDAQAAVPALIELLGSQEVIDRRVAALTLGQIGAAASEAVPLLVDALEDDDNVLQQFAVAALFKIEPDAVDSEAA